MAESQAIMLAEKFRVAFNSFEADRPETLELFTSDVFYREPRLPAFKGKEALREFLQQLAGEIRAMQLTWEYTNVVAQGNQVAVEWMLKSGIEFGGKRLELAGTSFFKVHDGRICYYNEYYDTAVLQQFSE